LVCSGLEHARRGYESFARECFEQLVGDPGLRLELVKGSGTPAPGERVVRTVRRDQLAAVALGRAAGVQPFRIEALAFGLALAPRLARARPDVVYLSEWDTARALARLRPLVGARYRLLLCNGGFAAAGFGHLDAVQELTPAARDYVLAHGADPARHTVLPLGFAIAPELALPSLDAREALRRRLELPEGRPIVLSVAALNRSHKRLDYLISELARLPEPRPFLLLAGEPDAETPAIRALAEDVLGSAGYAMRTVPAPAVPELYRASDVFVLASLAEMQGRAVIEAAAHGLPCLVHDSPVMRFALGTHGRYGDFTRPGELTALLSAAPGGAPPAEAAALHRHVRERFSWEHLRPHYVELLRSVARANSTVSSSTGEKLAR
jgi:glycosyltransferase involved in cell wall biosynthesis